jgi:hypothetical protein
LLKEIDGYGDQNVKKLLIGNKCDLIAERTVDYIIAKVGDNIRNIVPKRGIETIETRLDECLNLKNVNFRCDRKWNRKTSIFVASSYID